MLEALGLTLFHTGVVVDDLDASMTALSTLNGLHWAPPQITETPMVGPAGPLPRKVRFTYSIEGPHHVELLQQLDSAPYESLTGGRRVHHLGYLANDLEADAARLDAARAVIGEAGEASAWDVAGSGKLLARLVADDSYMLRRRLIPLVELLNERAGLPKVWTF